MDNNTFLNCRSTTDKLISVVTTLKIRCFLLTIRLENDNACDIDNFARLYFFQNGVYMRYYYMYLNIYVFI